MMTDGYYILCSDEEEYEKIEERAAFEKCLPSGAYTRYAPLPEDALELHGELRYYIEPSFVERFSDLELLRDG